MDSNKIIALKVEDSRFLRVGNFELLPAKIFHIFSHFPLALENLVRMLIIFWELSNFLLEILI